MGTTLSRPLSISPKVLLLIYAAIPVSLALVAIDILLLDRKLASIVELNPDNYPFFTLIFTLPHILSSYFGFFEKQYISTYGKRLLIGARYIVFGAIILSIISIELTFYVFALYTMYHVFRQQSGIARTLMKGKVGKSFQLWEWLGIVISFGIYVCVYANYRQQWVIYALAMPAIVYTYLGINEARSANSRLGSVYFWLTLSIPLVSGLFFILGYPLLTLALPRIIHDVTAYMFYVTHDHNRFLESGQNYIYKLSAKLSLPVVLVNPLLSIILAYLLQSRWATGGSITLTILFLFHYYFEGFIWKKNSPHREYIHIG